MSAKDTAAEKTTWVPICCESVMRSNVFQGTESSPVATLVCNSCGKHLTLQPHAAASIDEYGEGARIVQLVSVARPFRHRSDPNETGPVGEDTL